MRTALRLLLLGPLLLAADVTAQQEQRLAELSLEELMNLEVTSVSKRGENRFRAATAIYVLTGEEIRRSGLRSIPEVLRLVPGVHVGRLDGNKWAVTIRGLNGRYANNLLVLVDGRSIYTPLFGGVRWEERHVPLDEIERIEVIRGPTILWGTNAVNGVVNIITREPEEVLGSHLDVGGGTYERAFVNVRHARAVRDGAIRFYADYSSRTDTGGALGQRAHDAWSSARAGLRGAWQVSDRDRLSFQAEVSDGSFDETLHAPTFSPPGAELIDSEGEFSGGYLAASWQRSLRRGDDIQLLVFFDRAQRSDRVLPDTLETIDVEYRHSLGLGRVQELVWGAGFRLTENRLGSTPLVAFHGLQDHDSLCSVFVQDRQSFFDRRLLLTLGARADHNEYTGFEIQPTIRALWAPSERQSLWAAVTRAVRSPARFDIGVEAVTNVFPDPSSGLPVAATVLGNPEFESETLTGLELGYRRQLADRASIDIAAFTNRHRGIEVTRVEPPFVDSESEPRLVLPLRLVNGGAVESQGLEVVGNWDLRPDWRITGIYSLISISEEAPSLEPPGAPTVPTDDSPAHQAQLLSRWDLDERFSFDLSLFYVDRLRVSQVEDYVRLDVGLQFRLRDDLTLYLHGQNLVEDRHTEFRSDFIEVPTQVVRGGLFGLRLSF